MISIMPTYSRVRQRLGTVYGNHTLTSIDTGINAYGTVTVTLPASPSTNQSIVINNTGSGTVTVSGTITGGYSGAELSAGASITLTWNGSTWDVTISSGTINYISISYHDGTLQNTYGGYDWATLFLTFDADNICETIGKVPVVGNIDSSPPYHPVVDWYSSLGVLQNTVVVNTVVYPTNGLLEYQMLGLVVIKTGLLIATMEQANNIIRILKVTDSSYSILAEFTADNTPSGSVLFHMRMNADNSDNAYIRDQTYIDSTREITPAGVVIDTGESILPPFI